MSEVDGVGLSAMFNEIKQKNKPQKKGNPDHYYPKIIINKTKRLTLYFMLPALLAVMTAVIYQDLMEDIEWTSTAAPALLIGILCLFLPASEEWEYKPWQGASQQMERELKE